MGAILNVKYYNTFLLKKVADPAASSHTTENDWFVEESRIKGEYNNVSAGLAPRAYLSGTENSQKIRNNALIYSGILNTRTGVNETNQFSVAKDITKAVDPSRGSIQKLYAEDTNLIIFQERKVSKGLIDKDAIYSAEGGGTITSSNNVIGQIIPFGGEFGIGKNPRSFAVYGYRKYFVDANKGAVLRLSNDGITPISSYGMTDFFRDELVDTSDIVGGWDIHNKMYTLSITNGDSYNTLTFDEKVNGWTSFLTFKPREMFSLRDKFYSISQDEPSGTTANGKSMVYEHYSSFAGRGSFFGSTQNSTVELIFNRNPSTIKSFKTINFEGNGNWEMDSFTTETDSARSVGKYSISTTLAAMNDSLFENTFKSKEGKYFASLNNKTTAGAGEIVFGDQISGVKGFTANVKFKVSNSYADRSSNELFAVSSEFTESSY